MAHFARLDQDNKVIEVHVLNDSVITDESNVKQEQLGIDFLTDLYGGGWWKQSFKDGSSRKNHASIGMTYELPTITQGIVSKVFDDKLGIFLTTAAINAGNSGGPIFDLNGKLVGIGFATVGKKKILDEYGQIPTDMGYAIKSNMIKEVFDYKKSVPIKSAKYDKATIYEKMLPSIALIVVLIDE